MSRKNRGFTLIELLVVIAIIAILAAILFPVFARARAKARAITCLSNLKQLAVAELQYVADNDSQFPFVCAAGEGPSAWEYYDIHGCPCCPDITTYYWGNYVGRRSLVPYVKNLEIFVCPEDRDYHGAGWRSSGTGYDNENPRNWITKTAEEHARLGWSMEHIFGYAFNNLIHGWCDDSCCGPPCVDPSEDENSIKLAAKCFMMADARVRSNFSCGDICFGPPGVFCDTQGCCLQPDPCSKKTQLGGISVRHNCGANVSFVDGHAKWMPIKTLAQFYWDAGTPYTEGYRFRHGMDTYRGRL